MGIIILIGLFFLAPIIIGIVLLAGNDKGKRKAGGILLAIGLLLPLILLLIGFAICTNGFH